MGPGYKCPFPVGNISWKTWKMLLVGPAIDGKVYESDLINDGWNRTLWLSTLYHPPKSFWLLRNFICVRNLTLMLYENDARSIHLFVIIFLIKKKCTHLRSAITKANFEFLFQHRHFFIAWLWWWYYYILEGKWQNISNQDFFKKKSIYIFLVMIDRVFLSKIMLYLQD